MTNRRAAGRMHLNGRSRAFTIVDLLVVLLIVCLVSSVVISGPLGHARETAYRVKCGSNLRQIGQAMMLYANENKGNYPRTIYKAGEPVTQYTGVDCKNPFEGDGRPKNNDVTAALFLLVRTQDISAVNFICPSTDAEVYTFGGGDHTAQDVSNFPSDQNLSYSFINPYPDAAAVTQGYRVNATVGAEVAIAADMNPGKFGDSDVTPATGPKNEMAPAALMRKANSLNHRADGENVLFGDGHVEFQQNPFCGVRRDNIYTVAGSKDGSKTTSETIAGSPVWQGDSVLLPGATWNPHKRTPEQEEVEETKAMQREITDAFKRMDTTTPEFQAMKQAIEAKLAEQGGKLAAPPLAAPGAVAAVTPPVVAAPAPSHEGSSGATMLLIGIAIGVATSLLAGGMVFVMMKNQKRAA
ncbi:MAG: putative major pilin subunit [Phycisphaerales bacterium]|nr:putative major pilin subunit [Phycisphaerales bacterium]